jgi:ribosomal-protein-alanine N-acetyltransferase
VIYRPYTPEDFAALYAIEELCFEPLFRFGRRSMRLFIGRANAATWLAEEDGELKGFAIVEWTGHKSVVSVSGPSLRECKSRITAYIQTIEVAPEARRRGIGRALLGHLEDSALTAGAEWIRLHVDAENANAIRLYEAQGYHCQGRRENYYPLGRAALIYRKRLDPDSVS